MVRAISLSCVLCCACSLALDANQKQCTADADCLSRGLKDTTCVANLCQPRAPAAGKGSIDLGVEGTAGSGATSETPPLSPSGRDAGADVRPPTSGAGAGGAAAAAGGAAGARAASGAAAAAGAGGMTGAAGCEGESCPQCSTDEDCVKKGVAAGKCIDSKCWGPTPQCKADPDCETLGPEYVGGKCIDTQCRPNPKWRCEPDPLPAMTDTLDLSVPAIDGLSLKFIADVPMVSCNKLDYMCTSPVSMAKTAMDGRAKITVPSSFVGYLQATGRTDYLPSMYFMPAALPSNGQLPNWPIIPAGGAINALALTIGASLDSTRGHILLVVHDCFGKPLPGIVFSSPQADKTTILFYIRDEIPSATAKNTPDEGDGGYLNFPVGTALITATDEKTGIELGTASLLIRAGVISVLYIRPSLREAMPQPTTTQN